MLLLPSVAPVNVEEQTRELNEEALIAQLEKDFDQKVCKHDVICIAMHSFGMTNM